MSNLLNLALSALDRGWSIIPVKCVYDEEKGKVKKPATVQWLKYQKERIKKSELLTKWNDKLLDEPGIGYAIVCGEISNLFVVDVDSEEARAKVEELMGDSVTRTVSTPGGGYHFYFVHTDGFDNQASIGVPGLDYRTNGGYVVGPGSQYPDGSKYILVRDTEIIRIPDQLRSYLIENIKEKKGKREDVVEPGSEDDNWFTRILRDGFIEGQRVDQLKRVVGLMVGENRSHEYIQIMVNIINQNSETPLPQKELDDQCRSMLKKFKGKEEAQHGELNDRIYDLNDRYAQITLGGKPMILRFKEDPEPGEEDFDLLQVSAMRTETKHLIQWMGRTPVRLTALWEESSYRRRYQDIIFNPSLDPQTDYIHGENGRYNLWRGFAVEPKQGDWNLFRSHICEVLAPGYGDYVIKWLARMIQEPGGRRPGKVLVFRGKQGTGKSFARKIIGKLLGKHYYKTDDIQHLIGRFNNAVSNVIFLALEEAMWAGDRSQVGKLKERVTSRTLSIEKKGIEVITVDNHLNIWMNSNERWVVPVQDADRRFVVFDVADTYMNNLGYFQKIQDQMDSGGYEAMLYDLLQEKWTMEELVKSPKTAAGFDQYSRDNSSIKQFALHILSYGTVHPLHKGWKKFVIKRKFYESYDIFCQKQHYTYKETEVNFSKDIQKYIPCDKARKRFGKLYGGSRSIESVVQFPSLEYCRQYFSEDYEIKWDDPEITDTLTPEERETDIIDDYETHFKGPF